MGRSVSFFLDEHMPKAVARGLRQRGIDALTVAEAMMLGASDEELLARAQADGRVFVTRDRDFLRLHVEEVEHSGIAYATRKTTIGAIIRGLMLISQVLEADDMKRHVEYL